MGAVIVVRVLSRARGRFQGGNLQHLALVDALRTVAQTKGATVAQAAIAWVAPRPPISCRWSEPAAAIASPRPSAPRRTLSQRERNYHFIAASSGMAAPRRARSVS